MSQLVQEFMRFSAPDPEVLARSIALTREELAAAIEAGEALPIVELASDLGSMLTTARNEEAAVQVLAAHMTCAQEGLLVVSCGTRQSHRAGA